MGTVELSQTKQQAHAALKKQNKFAKSVNYMKKLDKHIFRLGKKDDNRMTRVRHLEDDRPLISVNKRTQKVTKKRNEIITYVDNNKLYVVAKSGGVSLFDTRSEKLDMGNNDCWYCLAPLKFEIPDKIIIAKDKESDEYGSFHYSFQPEEDMEMLVFKEKLQIIGRQLKEI